MANPVRGIFLQGKFYNFEEGSFRESLELKNTATTTQNSRTFSAQGLATPTYSLTLHLDSTYRLLILPNLTTTGETTWMGLSRLTDLKTMIDAAQGVSLPLQLITPYGTTRNVVPTGSLDVEMFRPSNPSSTAGVEFRVSLTLVDTTLT